MRYFLFVIALFCHPEHSKGSPVTLHNVKFWGSDASVSITWEGDSIVSVDESSQATGIDGGGGYITPGLIDSGSTVGIQGVDLSTSSRDHRYEGTGNTVSFNPLLAFNPDSSIVPSLLAEGVTHAVLKPGVGKDIFAGQSGLVDLSGDIASQESLAVFVYMGDLGWKQAGSSRAAALQRLVLGLEEAGAYVDNRRAYGRNQLRKLSFSTSDLEVLASVIEREKKLVLYIDRASEILSTLRALERYNLDIILMGAREAWKIADTLAGKDIPVVINAMDNLPLSFDRLGARLDQPALLHKAGVRFAFMTDDLYGESRMLKQSAGIAVAYGLSWQRALEAVTETAAEIWGLDSTLGTIDPGRSATFVVWDGDPLEVTSEATLVVVDGRIIERVNRQDLLRERYRNI